MLPDFRLLLAAALGAILVVFGAITVISAYMPASPLGVPAARDRVTPLALSGGRPDLESRAAARRSDELNRLLAVPAGPTVAEAVDASSLGPTASSATAKRAPPIAAAAQAGPAAPERETGPTAPLAPVLAAPLPAMVAASLSTAPPRAPANAEMTASIPAQPEPSADANQAASDTPTAIETAALAPASLGAGREGALRDPVAPQSGLTDEPGAMQPDLDVGAAHPAIDPPFPPRRGAKAAAHGKRAGSLAKRKIARAASRLRKARRARRIAQARARKVADPNQKYWDWFRGVSTQPKAKQAQARSRAKSKVSQAQ